MTHDLIIIGAGPAGMAAALTAAKLGLRTALLDEQARPGGQIYRNIGNVAREVGDILGPDYLHGRTLAAPLGDAKIDQHFGATVWDVGSDLIVSVISGDRSYQLQAPQLIAATGAMERASPIPGWTLPGVLNAGAAQIALKSGGSVPAGRIVLAGGGPLLLLVACQLLNAGADVAGIVETSERSNWLGASRHVAQALLAPRLLAKGLKMMRQLKSARIAWFAQARDLAVEGDTSATGLRFQCGPKQHHLMADVVLLHHGVVPNTQLSRLLRVEHNWNDAQLAWHPRTDAFCETSQPGFRIAGDGGGIAGALAAEASGQIAVLGTAHALGRITTQERDRMAKAPMRALRAQLRIRPFLDALYRPPGSVVAPSGQTIVCRCEEVTAQEIASMARIGCLGPNQTKFFSRCGMGPCQGRICGLSVTNILAREHGSTVEATGAYRVRAPLKPIPLSAIANVEFSTKELSK